LNRSTPDNNWLSPCLCSLCVWLFEERLHFDTRKNRQNSFGYLIVTAKETS
jgi:hypothetical protein